MTTIDTATPAYPAYPAVPDALPAAPALQRGLRLQWEPSQQSWVLLYPEGMVVLNASAAAILRHCDGVRTLPQIVAALEAAFGTGLEPDIRVFVCHAVARGWLG